MRGNGEKRGQERLKDWLEKRWRETACCGEGGRVKGVNSDDMRVAATRRKKNRMDNVEERN